LLYPTGAGAGAPAGTRAGGTGAALGPAGGTNRLPSGISFPDGNPMSGLSLGLLPFLVLVGGPRAFAATASNRMASTAIPLILEKLEIVR
jgi:hypothetical protein